MIAVSTYKHLCSGKAAKAISNCLAICSVTLAGMILHISTLKEAHTHLEKCSMLNSQLMSLS